MRLTKRQLKRIIREEKRRLIEAGGFYDEHDMEAAESADLYTNISDQESASLDALENCVWDCIDGGCAEEDIMDTVQAALKDAGGAQGYER